MNAAMWQEIRLAFQWVDETPEARVAVLQGEGKLFTAGIDLQMMMGLGQQIQNECDGRTREALRRLILDMQDTLTSLERCRKPVLAAIHGACDIGMTADVGTLQRLPRLVGEGIARELAYTGRNFAAEEARQIGLVNRLFESREALYAGVREIAATIAAKSPLSIRGTKEMITYARDHSVADSLNYIATWNAAMLMSQDLKEAMLSNMAKKAPSFKD
jgi:enoyl-CoA hydratase